MSMILLILCGLLSISSPIDVYSLDNSSVSHTQLSVEEAKELLLKYNSNVDYIYQGEASKFEYLKSKNLQGYVFLPNVPTDMGYFVDKNTCTIYDFHPSGYLEPSGELPPKN